MKTDLKNLLGIVLCSCFCLLSVTTTAQTKFKKLVWADEFNKPGLPDESKWGYDTARGCPQNCGWGNNELQYYTFKDKKNARVENGKLIVETRKETKGDAAYTSARLLTKNKGDWKYGRIEVKARIPQGKGMWPAIWMLPTKWAYGGWPKSGEIDIMEHVGYWKDSVFGTVHTGAYNGMLGTQKGKSISRNDWYNAFHVYAIEWTENEISFFVDKSKYFVFKNEHTNTDAWPFDQSFHLLINIAVGGNWGGKFGVDDSVFPQRMEIDYVRIYQ